MQATTKNHDRFTALADEQAFATTLAALEARGFGAEVVDDLDAARDAVVARIPLGSTVITNPSVTLEETGIAHIVNESGLFESPREKMASLDRERQLREIKALFILPDFALGSVHAVTRDGTLVVASNLGSQLAEYAWGAANVILVVGGQKLVTDREAAHRRIQQHCLPLENERALRVYGQESRIGKILEIHADDPGRIHVVLIRAAVGF